MMLTSGSQHICKASARSSIGVPRVVVEGEPFLTYYDHHVGYWLRMACLLAGPATGSSIFVKLFGLKV